jgi:hypothetical protein
MDICVKYAQCVKYDHLCENLSFIGYLCEMCSMFENMIICVKI